MGHETRKSFVCSSRKVTQLKIFTNLQVINFRMVHIIESYNLVFAVNWFIFLRNCAMNTPLSGRAATIKDYLISAVEEKT